MTDNRAASDAHPASDVRHPASAKVLDRHQTRQLLVSDPVAAEMRARELLASHPEDGDARLLLGASLRRQDKAAAARTVLEPVAQSNPDSAFALLELGLTLSRLGEDREALAVFARAVDAVATFAPGWYAFAQQLERVERASGRSSMAASDDSEAGTQIHRAEEALQREQFGVVESILRSLSECRPADADILRVQADSAFWMGRLPQAEELLTRCLDIAPGEAVRLRYAVVLLAQGKGHLAMPSIGDLVRHNPPNIVFCMLRASALYETGDFLSAIAQFEQILAERDDLPGMWISYGRALRAVGRQEECVGAFQRAIEIAPGFGEGYRTLATVKTRRFEPAAIDAIRNQLAKPALLAASRAQLHFALAKALEDAGHYADSFENYRESNALQAYGVTYSPDTFTNLVRRAKALFTRDFFRAHTGAGAKAPDPIFIVGMPRSGSTLVQEMLAAHPAIERTGELRTLPFMAMRLRGEKPGYPELLARMDPGRLVSLGEEYLARTRPHRKLGLPYFVDKHPENFLHAGLIQLMLPNARIVDVRRHPLDCCFSCFRNYFPEGPAWSHRLEDLGRYYADYVEFMAHFDEVLPGRIYRIIYERLIADPERELRRLFDYLGLPFAEQCLRFYETEQAIVTTSVEQARQPIYSSGIDNSRNYDSWLGPLKSRLGDVLAAYPEAPRYYPSVQATFSLRLA